MIIYPKAKINLGLRVTEKRSDGFHNLESLFVDLPQLTDILEIMESDKLSFSLYGAGLDCAPGQNICEKAYNMLSDDFGLPGAEIHLFKKIPTGAGLGGGSSDGACTLVLLNRLYNLGLDTPRLMEYAGRLGSDCSFFVMAHAEERSGYTTAMVKGRGDKPVPYRLEVLDHFEIRVVNSGIFISTAEAYSGVIPNQPEIQLEQVLSMPVKDWKDYLINDFEQHIFCKYPILDQYKQQLYADGAIYASMSGSGSALYGIFDK